MNAFIHFPETKTKFKVLVFPETFDENKEQLQVLQNSLWDRFEIGYLNPQDIELSESSDDSQVSFPEYEIDINQLSMPPTGFPIKFDKNIRYSIPKRRRRKGVQQEPIDQQELWKKIFWASTYIDEYGEGDYDFIVVGDSWLNQFTQVPHSSTIAFSDFINIVRANITSRKEYFLAPNDNLPSRYDFFYDLQANLIFHNFLTLNDIGHDPNHLKNYSPERQRDIHEALTSLGNRLKNVVMSYDEANAELFLPSYSSKADYRISNFFSECASVFEDIVRVILTLYSEEDRKDIFTQPVRLYHYKIKKLVTPNRPNFYEAYYDKDVEERYTILRIIRNKMRHGDATNIEDWKFEGEILKVPMLKLFHLDLDEELIKGYAEKNNLYMTPFWWDETDKENGLLPIGHKLPLRETLDFAYETVVMLVNKLVKGLIGDIFQNTRGLRLRGNRWNMFKNHCEATYSTFFKDRFPTIYFNFAYLKYKLAFLNIRNKDNE